MNRCTRLRLGHHRRGGVRGATGSGSVCQACGMDRPVVVMAALTSELGLLRMAMADPRETRVGGHRFHVGAIGECDVVATTVGVGKVNAAMVATLAIDRFSPREILFTGVAGGIDHPVAAEPVALAPGLVLLPAPCPTRRRGRPPSAAARATSPA